MAGAHRAGRRRRVTSASRSCPIAGCARSTASSAARTRSPTSCRSPRTARGFHGRHRHRVGRREAAGEGGGTFRANRDSRAGVARIVTSAWLRSRADDGKMARFEARLRKKAGLKEGLIRGQGTALDDDPTFIIPPGMCRDLSRHRLSGVQCADAAVAAHSRRAYRSRRCARAVSRGSAPPLHSGAPADQHADDPGGGAPGPRHRASIRAGFPVLVLSIVIVVLDVRAPDSAAHRPPGSGARARRAVAVVRRIARHAEAADKRAAASGHEPPPAATCPASAPTRTCRPRRPPVDRRQRDVAPAPDADRSRAGGPGPRAAPQPRRLPRDDGARGDDAAAGHHRHRARRDHRTALRAVPRAAVFAHPGVQGDARQRPGIRLHQGPDPARSGDEGAAGRSRR